MSKKPTMQSDMVVKKNKKPFIIVGSILAILVVVAIGFFVLKSMEVVATPALRVGEVEVSQADFDEYVKLGEAQGMSKIEVRELVVEYEKNRQMAEEFNIKVSEELIEHLRNKQEAAQSITRPQVGGDALSRVHDYNRTFELQLSQANVAGYGLFVYEIGPLMSAGSIGDTSGDGPFNAASEVASSFRDSIVKDKMSPASVLEQVSAYNAQNGQAVNSNFTFVEDGDGFYDGDPGAHVKSHEYLLGILKDDSEDPLKIRRTDRNSAFFMYKIFEHNAQEDVVEQVGAAKEQVRVVIYDK